MNEEFYINGLRAGDEKAFRVIFEKFHTRLCYFADGILNGSLSREDIVQNAFIKLWQKRTDFLTLESIKAFLYIAVKNQCLNIQKHDRVLRKYEGMIKLNSDEEVVMHYRIEAEVLEKVYQALQKLPPGCRNVLQLSYFEGMKNKDVASRMQVSVNTIKTQKKRALYLLRTFLKTSSLWLFALLQM